MSGEKYIKLAVVAALCEHPDADKYLQSAFSADHLPGVMEAMARQQQALTKADFLTPEENGKLILDSVNAWKNLHKIVKVLQDNGDRLTLEDFIKPMTVGGQKTTLIDIARERGGLANVFSLNVWQGHFDEMERVWHRVPLPNRKELFKNDGLLSLDLKRQMLEAEGRSVPEDRLAKAGLSPSDIRNAFLSRERFVETTDKLQRAGDYLCKEYVLMTDSAGDTVFWSSKAWDLYDDVVTHLKSHGERLEIADYVGQVSYTRNILGRAAEGRVLHKIFTPAHWADRLQDMLALWSCVLDGWKISPMAPRDFDNAYTEAESLTYTGQFGARAFTGKADLLKPLNSVSGEQKPVLPLGLKAVWEKLDVVQEVLDKNGEKLTVADLRLRTGQMENTCLISAAKFGYFGKALGILKQSGEQVTLDDFLSKDAQGNTLINILAEKQQLLLAFSPDLWVGRVGEMRALWQQVNPTYRHQVDFQQLEVSVKQATLKQKKGSGFKLGASRPKKDA